MNSVVNIALVPADLNLKIGAKAPSKYLAQYKTKNSSWDRTLDSHMISGDTRTVMEADDYLLFIEKRAELLSQLALAAIEPSSGTARPKATGVPEDRGKI